MSEKDIIIFPTSRVANSPIKSSAIRAKAYDIKAPPEDFNQYKNTVRAFNEAGMPYEYIANAGQSRGDQVTTYEVDAPLKDRQDKIGEVAEDESKILAWQTRGEKISVTPQLSSPHSVTDQEMITISQGLIKDEQTSEKIMNVIEGIRVSLRQDSPSELPNATPHDQELENNPYLKKAA